MTTTTLPATDEVVTHARVQDVALPGGAGTFALITLDNGFDHTKPNSFGPQGLAELAGVLDELHRRADAGEIVGVGITGKPFIFAVGADLTGVPAIATREQALEALDRDREFLTRGGVFDNDMIDAFITLKMEEVTRLRMVPHPIEFDMYYSC